MKAAPARAMRIALVVLLLALAGAVAAQAVRGMPERQTSAKKQDVTAGGGNSSVGATRPQIPQDKKARFSVLDLDGDGRISLAEAAGHSDVVVHFDRADRNRDGKLTLAEYENLGRKPAAKKKGERRPRTTARTADPRAAGAGTHSASPR